MKISFVIPFFPNTANGGCKIIFEYANFLVNKGHNVNIFMTGKEAFLQRYRLPKAIKNCAQKYIVEKKRIDWFSLDTRVKRIAIDNIDNDTIMDGDIIFATAVETAEPVDRLRAGKGKKCYLIQDFENWDLADEEVCNTYRLGMYNIVVSSWLKKTVDEYSRKPALLLSNSIDTKVFKVNMPVEKRKEHSLVFHYRKAVHKGAKYAIKTLKILKDRYKDLVVYVVTNEKDATQLPDYCVVYHNITAEEVAKINNRAQVFMCSSIEEGFGLPGLEALACGCALVTTNYRGAKEYAIDGVNALISEVKDSEAMAENIIHLFEDEELRMRLAQAGIHTAQERSLEKTGDMLEKYLKEILEKNLVY